MTLEALQGGDHDPCVNGFTLRALDLSVAGGSDPYFDAFATLGVHLDPEGETVVELEEAFLQTQSLPHGLELRAGQLFTEFGLHNPSHPHDWDWLDKPAVKARLFGPDGARAPGVRLAWAPIEGLRLLAGAQNATGETMASFLASEEFYDERPVGGRAFSGRDVDSGGELVYRARLETAASLGEATALGFGLSAMLGPNASGPDGLTRIFGADLKLAHGPLTLQAEGLHRRYEADADPANGFAPDDLADYGGYVQALYAGARPGPAACVTTMSPAPAPASEASRAARKIRSETTAAASRRCWSGASRRRPRSPCNIPTTAPIIWRMTTRTRSGSAGRSPPAPPGMPIRHAH